MNEKEIILPELHPAQQQVMREAKRFNVVDCGRRWGKSALAVNLLSETALDGYPAGYFTPTYKLLDGTYNECLSALNPIIRRKNEHKFIELITGGRIEFWSLENELAGRSRKYKRTICDEAAFAKELWVKWTEGIRATLTDYKGDGWFFSTPRGKNDFHRMYLKGKGADPKWMSWQMSTYTNPYIDKDEIDDAQKDLPPLAFSQEYLAEFNENVANPFGQDAIKKNIMPLSTFAPVVFGIDLAKSYDYTVIIGLDHLGAVCVFDRFQGDWNTTLQKIRSLPKGVPKRIDSTGVGDPIVEQLEAEGINVYGYKFTSTSKQELMRSLQVAIQNGAISYPDGVIPDELSIFEYEYTSSGVKYSAPSGFHDDCVCALGLAWHEFQFKRGTGQYDFA